VAPSSASDSASVNNDHPGKASTHPPREPAPSQELIATQLQLHNIARNIDFIRDQAIAQIDRKLGNPMRTAKQRRSDRQTLKRMTRHVIDAGTVPLCEQQARALVVLAESKKDSTLAKPFAGFVKAAIQKHGPWPELRAKSKGG
jgi:hypothetical protein